MARTKTTKAAAKPVEPEHNPHEAPETEAAGAASGPATGGKAMSKSAAARAALTEGIGSPQKACEFILKRFGIDMSPQHFSAVKSQWKAASEAPAKKKKSAVEGYLAPPPKRSANGGADVLESLEVLKPLIAQYGSDKVKRMIDLLG
jgi:hypothetical protein